MGINTTNPLSTLDINGNLSVKTVTLNGTNSGGGGSATLIDDGVYISVRPLATDDKFQLPNPASFPGRIYVIRNIQNSVTAQLTTASGMFFHIFRCNYTHFFLWQKTGNINNSQHL